MANTWIGLYYFIVCFSLALAVTTIEPCSATLEEIYDATLVAQTSRSACERSYFSSSACEDYWAQAGHILELETNFRDCRKLTVDEFLKFLVGANWNDGEIARQAQITRDAVVYNAQQTQNLFVSQSQSTRNTVDSQAEATRTLLESVTRDENAQTRSNHTAEAQATRALIIVEHGTTRNLVDTQAQATRQAVAAQGEDTREVVATESAATRTVLTQVIQEDGQVSRANTSAEANLTRQTVQEDGDSTRAVIIVQGEVTRQTIVDQSTTTRNTVATAAQSTNAQILTGVNTITSTIQGLQSTQTGFIDLFVKIMIQGSFSTNPNYARVDLFQRPQANGGYYETMKAIVTEVVAYNRGRYNLGTSRNNDITGYINAAIAYEGLNNHRKAWENWRLAYLSAVIP